jgi:hypothetical protein
LEANVRTSGLKMGAISFFERSVPKRKLNPTAGGVWALSVLCDEAVQVVRWRRTGRAGGVASSESEDRDRQTHDPKTHCTALPCLDLAINFLSSAEHRAAFGSVSQCPVQLVVQCSVQ